MRLLIKNIVILLLIMPISAYSAITKGERDRAVLKSFIAEVSDSIKMSDNDETKIHLLNELLSQSSKNNYREGIIFARRMLGERAYLRGEYGYSLKEYFAALSLQLKQSASSELAETYRSIGEIYRAVNHKENALAYLDTAETIFASRGDMFGVAKTKNRQAAVKQEIGQWSTAISLCDESNRILNGIKPGTVDIEELRGNNYNIIALIYQSRKSDSAFFFYYKSIEAYRRSPQSIDICGAYINLANTYLSHYQPDSALTYSLASYELSRQRNVYPYMQNAAITAASAYYLLGNYKRAYDFLKQGMELRSSILNEKTASKVAEVQKSFEHAISQTEFRSEQKKAEYLAIIAVSILLLSTITILGLRKKSSLIKRKNAELSSAYKLIYLKNQDLDELNETKDKFFSLIAHDLKNPLGAIKFLSETLHVNYTDFEEAEKREYIEEITKTSHHLNQLLENLLSWARSQQGKVKFNPERNDICTLINTVIMLMESAAKKKSIKLQFQGLVDRPLIIDANMINTVLRNLISNAIKFTDDGGAIVITAKESPTSDNGRVAVISVKDNGVGMTSEEIEKLFKIDKVFSKLGTKEEKGTGLGLILCKEFVERHGGSIWVESECGKGSCFKFTIPSAAGKN